MKAVCAICPKHPRRKPSKCDLFDYLTGKEEYAQLFKGSYLTNYSWGETTLAELTGEYLYAAPQ